MVDDLLTVGPEPGSQVVDRAQGMIGFADLHDTAIQMGLNILFTEGKYKGSTIVSYQLLVVLEFFEWHVELLLVILILLTWTPTMAFLSTLCISLITYCDAEYVSFFAFVDFSRINLYGLLKFILRVVHVRWDVWSIWTWYFENHVQPAVKNQTTFMCW